MHKHSLLFGTALLRATMDSEGVTWWAYDDVCKAIEFHDAVRFYSQLNPLYKRWDLLVPSKGREKIFMINDLDLYQLLLKSRIGNHPSFQRFITKEIFPAVLKGLE